MTVTSMEFDAIPGAYSIQSALLTNVVPLKVEREGMGFKIIVGSAPGNREAQYSDGEGKLTFQNPFSGSLTDDTAREKIYVRYKY